MILKRKVLIDGVIYFVKDITNITCMIYSTKGKKVYNEAIIHDVFDYGDKIVDYVKHKSETLYRYDDIDLITFFWE